MSEWWKTFFDHDYLRVWGQMFTDEEERARLRSCGRCWICNLAVACWMRRAAMAGFAGR